MSSVMSADISTKATTRSTASGTIHPRLATSNGAKCHIPSHSLHCATSSRAFGTTFMPHCTGSSVPSGHLQPRLCGLRLGFPSLLDPGCKHGGRGTWQLMMSEEGFQAA